MSQNTEYTVDPSRLVSPDAAPADAAEVDYVVHEDVPAEEPEAPAAEAHKSCPQCGAPVSDDALFCNKCGAQL